MKLTKKGKKVVKTISSRIDNLIRDGYKRSNAIEKARYDNGHHPGCLSDLTIQRQITQGDWESLVKLGYAEVE